MSSSSFLRGHRIIFKNDKWLYEDDMTPIHSYGAKMRPCKKCNSIHEFHESDKCLGNLPGVNHACCGHGVRKQSYIKFTNGIVIKDFEIEENGEQIK